MNRDLYDMNHEPRNQFALHTRSSEFDSQQQAAMAVLLNESIWMTKSHNNDPDRYELQKTGNYGLKERDNLLNGHCDPKGTPTTASRELKGTAKVPLEGTRSTFENDTRLHSLLRSSPTLDSVCVLISFLVLQQKNDNFSNDNNDNNDDIHHTEHNNSKTRLKFVPEEAVDSYGRTPLHIAADEGCDLAIVQRLVVGNRSAQMVDRMGRYPLHYACMNPFGCRTNFASPQTARNSTAHFLPTSAAAIGAPNSNTAIKCNDCNFDEDDEAEYEAQYNNLVGVITTLLWSYPKAVSCPDRDGNTPLQLARQYDASEEILRLLQSSERLSNKYLILRQHKKNSSRQIKNIRGQDSITDSNVNQENPKARDRTNTALRGAVSNTKSFLEEKEKTSCVERCSSSPNRQSLEHQNALQSRSCHRKSKSKNRRDKGDDYMEITASEHVSTNVSIVNHSYRHGGSSHASTTHNRDHERVSRNKHRSLDAIMVEDNVRIDAGVSTGDVEGTYGVLAKHSHTTSTNGNERTESKEYVDMNGAETKAKSSLDRRNGTPSRKKKISTADGNKDGNKNVHVVLASVTKHNNRHHHNTHRILPICSKKMNMTESSSSVETQELSKATSLTEITSSHSSSATDDHNQFNRRNVSVFYHHNGIYHGGGDSAHGDLLTESMHSASTIALRKPSLSNVTDISQSQKLDYNRQSNHPQQHHNYSDPLALTTTTTTTAFHHPSEDDFDTVMHFIQNQVVKSQKGKTIKVKHIPSQQNQQPTVTPTKSHYRQNQLLNKNNVAPPSSPSLALEDITIPALRVQSSQQHDKVPMLKSRRPSPRRELSELFQRTNNTSNGRRRRKVKNNDDVATTLAQLQNGLISNIKLDGSYQFNDNHIEVQDDYYPTILVKHDDDDCSSIGLFSANMNFLLKQSRKQKGSDSKRDFIVPDYERMEL